MLVSLIAALALINEPTANAETQPTGDCQPCVFSVSPHTPPYSFRFEIKKNEDGRTITAIVAKGANVPEQRLPVDDMSSVDLEKPFTFALVDINFDGFLDLALVTESGISNEMTNYWRFDVATGTFVAVGKFPTFRLDRKRKRLTNRANNGGGGRIYEADEYQFVGDTLSLVSQESQDVVEGKNDVFRRVFRARRGNEMKVVRSKVVRY